MGQCLMGTFYKVAGPPSLKNIDQPRSDSLVQLCYERLDEGFEPFCALCCGVEAISWGDLAESDGKLSQMISQRKAYTLKPEKKTGPAVYYCPPMSPRRA